MLGSVASSRQSASDYQASTGCGAALGEGYLLTHFATNEFDLCAPPIEAGPGPDAVGAAVAARS